MVGLSFQACEAWVCWLFAVDVSKVNGHINYREQEPREKEFLGYICVVEDDTDFVVLQEATSLYLSIRNQYLLYT